jgi:hypothetical protein
VILPAVAANGRLLALLDAAVPPGVRRRCGQTTVNRKRCEQQPSWVHWVRWSKDEAKRGLVGTATPPPAGKVVPAQMNPNMRED